MPKKKRFRNGRGRKKRINFRRNSEKPSHEFDTTDTARVSPQSPRTDCLSTSLTEIFTPEKQEIKPSARNQFSDIPLNNAVTLDVPLITETPINKRRSWNRERKPNYESMNITNLNILFESNINHSPRSESSVTLCKNSSFQRSKSSIPKLHSPGQEKPLLVNQSTQTVESDLFMKHSLSITETPKYSIALLKEKTYSPKPFPFNKNEICSDKISISRFYEKGVNINPYLKNTDVQGKNRQGSVGEISFFSPNLFDHKTSSTPIDKLIKNGTDIEEQGAICDLNISKLDVHNSFIDNSFGTPKLNTNLNVNNGISPDKVRFNIF